MWQKRPAAMDDGNRKQLNGWGGWMDERRLSGQEEQNGNGWDGEQTETKMGKQPDLESLSVQTEINDDESEGERGKHMIGLSSGCEER